ncbi:sensor histidine kinase [Massilia arenosa]|uniref:Sensor histidine kinase n=1 Tax=Zemynaea arenosa TaxID=2561931 RepID=A0A4Y9SFK8_9BURK|nr:histidine kinase [Massilia arenosa]TFW18769.1 sensor histidine kinase [Massilia arenosa]
MTTGRTFDPARLAALPFRRPLLAALAISVCIAIMGVPDVLHNRPVFRALYLATYLAWIAPTAWLQRALWRRRLPWWGAALVLLAATYAMSLVNSVIGQTLAIYLGLNAAYKWDMIFVGLDSCWLPLIAFCATHAVVAYNAALAQEQARAAEAALLLRDAELRALRYQLQPHFLFNTLNALSSLVATGRQRDANRMIAQLADLLRATLAIGQAHEHSLADELALTESYLEIEKARLGERLHVTLDIGPGILDAQVPCLLLQPLVENAVRHGIAPRTEAGAVTLGIEARADRLHVRLRNDVPEGAVVDAGSSLRVGMRNVAERLERLYGGEHRFHTQAAGSGGQFEVLVELPLRVGESASTTWARAA